MTDWAVLAWRRTQHLLVAKAEAPFPPVAVGQLAPAEALGQAAQRGCMCGTAAVQRKLQAVEHWVGCPLGVRLAARRANRRS